MKNNKKRRLTAISMFSGCGGLDLGFHQAGFDVLWANDNQEDSCHTYRKNFVRLTKKDVLEEGDIRSVKRPDLDAQKDLTVLLGGFPCQAYSNAGQRNGIKDGRGMLYKYCLEFVDSYKPKFVVFENVRGFLTIQGKNGRLIEEIAHELDNLGYQVHIKLLNAANYDVPQNRLRVFMIAVRKNLNIRNYRFPMQRFNMDLQLGAVLQIPKNTPNQKDIITLNPQAYEIGNLVPEGGSWKSIEYDALPPRLQKIRDNIRKYRWPNFYRRFSREEIAGTITAAFKPENAGVWHPTELRTFSAREIARIQSFPDSFIFSGRTIKSIYQMIGNAVPPALANAIADSIVQSIDSTNEKKPPLGNVRDYFETKAQGKPIRPEDDELVFDPSSEFAPGVEAA